jgi:hypothetical protein
MTYPTCTGCNREFEIGDTVAIFNDNEYHEFCAVAARHEGDVLVAEQWRKQKIWDENQSWLWEFQEKYKEWETRRHGGEVKYYG